MINLLITMEASHADDPGSNPGDRTLFLQMLALKVNVTRNDTATSVCIRVWDFRYKFSREEETKI